MNNMHGSYVSLCLDYPLRAVTNDEQLTAAMSVIDLLVKKNQLNDGEQEYLNTISDLVWAYEQKNDADDSANDSGAIIEVKALIKERTQLQKRASVLRKCLNDDSSECPNERADKRVQLSAMWLYINTLTSRIVRFSE